MVISSSSVLLTRRRSFTESNSSLFLWFPSSGLYSSIVMLYKFFLIFLSFCPRCVLDKFKNFSGAGNIETDVRNRRSYRFVQEVASVYSPQQPYFVVMLVAP